MHHFRAVRRGTRTLATARPPPPPTVGPPSRPSARSRRLLCWFLGLSPAE